MLAAMLRSVRGLAVLAAVVGTSGQARALTQPDGSPIPSTAALQGYLTAEGEAIDPATAAATTPQTFDPSCSLTFTVLARGGGQLNSFGWYNITGAKPAPADLHEFLGCNDGPGTKKTLEIKSDPAYQGGKIGFFMATTEGAVGNCVQFGPEGPAKASLGHVYYSEPQYNDDNTGADSYIHLVILDSKVYPKAFYFGWEDLFGGGDNDFEDLLTRVEGISCAGGGTPCETGQPGVCATGVQQCQSGALTCLQVIPPGTEACNAVDDDCDGEADEGEGLCPGAQVCFQGNCVAPCGGGEFSCGGGLTCDQASGLCVDTACVGVSCAAGQVCRGGTCSAACAGVQCPAGQVCRLDLCVDPCTGVQCPGGAVCELGVCKDKCACGSCPADKACAASGLCVDTGCESQSCADGQVCVAGQCRDACQGVVCPSGQECQGGDCKPAGNAGQGGSGVVVTGAGGSSGAAGKAGGGGAAGSAGSAG
ncbi:MAG: DUF4114 domain-containing protein, partial [Myxococcales bacterium]